MKLNNKSGAVFAYELAKINETFKWNQCLPCVFSVFSICPLWGSKRSRKYLVKHVAATVGYFVTVVGMESKVKREAFLYRI